MKLSLVIPSYNEARTLPRITAALCKELRQAEPSFELIIVATDSGDNTFSVLNVLKKHFPELKTVREPNRGFGLAVLRGINEAVGEVVGWVGADGQLPAEEVAKVYKALVEGQSSFCKGERKQSSKDIARKVQSMGYTTLFRILFGPLSTDINGTPKFLQRALLEQLHLESKDWFIDSECILKAAYLGHRPLEVPVLWKEREEGYSKVNVGAIFQFLKNIFVYKYIKKY